MTRRTGFYVGIMLAVVAFLLYTYATPRPPTCGTRAATVCEVRTPTDGTFP